MVSVVLAVSLASKIVEPRESLSKEYYSYGKNVDKSN